MRFNPEDQIYFRQALQNELVERCKRNPKYSLRAFSRVLGMEPSFLSKLLAGKRSFTAATIKKIDEMAGLHLVASGQLYTDLPIDSFMVISDWYHLAILELLSVKDFTPSVRKISQVLGISLAEAKSAVDRLERLGLISIQGKKWKNNTGHHSTLAMGSTNASLRALQKKILQQALEALEECSVELRDQSTITMAIDTKLLPLAKEKLKKFRRELCDFLQKDKDCDEVYQLSLSLFPVSKIKRGKT